jgi:hypothetical protein
MSQIFTGFLFIFLDFSLNLGRSSIELIPDFIGYIMIANGIEAMAAESPLFMKARPLSVFMIFYTGIFWFLNLFGVLVTGGLSVILGILSVVLPLYISNKIVLGVKDMEITYNTPLNGTSLQNAWNILTIFNILSLLSFLIPVLGVLCIIVAIIAAICFLAAFSRSKNLYYELKR